MAKTVRVSAEVDIEEVLTDISAEDVVKHFEENGAVSELLEHIGEEACKEYFDLVDNPGDDE